MPSRRSRRPSRRASRRARRRLSAKRRTVQQPCYRSSPFQTVSNHIIRPLCSPVDDPPNDGAAPCGVMCYNKGDTSTTNPCPNVKDNGPFCTFHRRHWRGLTRMYKQLQENKKGTFEQDTYKRILEARIEMSGSFKSAFAGKYDPEYEGHMQQIRLLLRCLRYKKAISGAPEWYCATPFNEDEEMDYKARVTEVYKSESHVVQLTNNSWNGTPSLLSWVFLEQMYDRDMALVGTIQHNETTLCVVFVVLNRKIFQDQLFKSNDEGTSLALPPQIVTGEIVEGTIMPGWSECDKVGMFGDVEITPSALFQVRIVPNGSQNTIISGLSLERLRDQNHEDHRATMEDLRTLRGKQRTIKKSKDKKAFNQEITNTERETKVVNKEKLDNVFNENITLELTPMSADPEWISVVPSIDTFPDINPATDDDGLFITRMDNFKQYISDKLNVSHATTRGD